MGLRGRWATFWFAAFALSLGPGCADIWGFSDLSMGSDGGNDGSVSGASGDGGTTSEAASEASAEAGDDGGPQGCPVDAFNCGACGSACDDQNSFGATCNGTSCQYARCAPGWQDCDKSGRNTNGCESSTSSTSSCGGCAACDQAHSLGATCSNGTCMYTGCAAGYADCKAEPPDTDGCETPTLTDTCAVCNAPGCDTMTSVGSCQISDAGAASCKYTSCAPGYDDCNPTPPDTHGCNTPITTAQNCGKCGQACDVKTSVGATCAGGACHYGSCAPNWADCKTAAPDTDGCETSLLSTATCGACTGAACDTTTGSPSCNGKTCSYQCSEGRADCNAGSPPDTDGCECATPGCCATQCETTHSNGIGQAFYDCTTTLSQTEAEEACAAAGADGCLNSSKCCALLSGLGACLGTTADSVCGTVGGECYCWQYSGNYPGTVQSMSPSNCSTICGASTDPKWK